MAVKVKTEYLSSFNLPPYCVACGSPPGTGRKKVSASKSDWTGKQTTKLEIEFPLCQHCAGSEKRTPWFITVFLAIIILVPLGLCLYQALVGFGGEKNLVLGIALYIATGVPLGLLFYLVRWISMSPEQRKIKRSVRITGFYTGGVFGKSWIRFKFENPSFAEQFAKLNLGKIQ